MSTGSNGLRFDVYERVHLPDDVAGIDELEEIELVPRIQVIDQGDQAVLKGQLLLSGVYRGQGSEAGPLALEHWIPVEISLPMNRVSRLDDISIEIDNFDVDLLSARTLNITGVLSLRGISVEPVEEQGLQWEDESFTAIHQRALQEPNEFEDDSDTKVFHGLIPDEAEAEYQAREEDEETGSGESYISEESAQAAEWQEAEEEQEQEVTVASREEAAEESWLQWNAEQQQAEPSTSYQPYVPQQPYQQQGVSQLASLYQQFQQPSYTQQPAQTEQISSREEPEWSESQSFRPEAEEEAAEEPVIAQHEEDVSLQSEEDVPVLQEIEPDPEPRKPQEVQIAFSGKSSAGTSDSQSDLGFRTLLQSSKREQAAREAAEQTQTEQEEAARIQSPEEEIEWKKLFLSKQAEEREFRKIRVCIVQREETLEQIALRYSLNPREILVHNGLHESSVAEGQLLYIP
ncbi:LysM peptidoglycan-binding domain-containing protein [Paenibacillus pinisoli]|uniref:LysM peptidoglycan-binding domain-containing protein n=1 Tax=Paenibacillus pinisoli TaxID=1276110 RepID=A0A3A6PPU1_9BACL|nr:LysM peptidoglycan-binding domain-containing protein [Paenibacillus pinisoli]RJX41428.1 LysM peptidoglycan-binding domain-containing protein [Paenibacillus pinisoli]